MAVTLANTDTGQTEVEQEETIRYRHRVVFLTLFFSIVSVGLLLLPFIDLDKSIQLFREDGPMEYFQALLFLIAGGLWIFVFLLKRREDVSIQKKILYLFLGTLMTLFFFEEISWGQRLFGYTTPDAMAEINTQGEANLHNMGVFGTGEPPYALLAITIFLVALILALLIRKYPHIRKHIEGILIPLRQYDLVVFLMLSLAFANYPSPPPAYWLIAIPFVWPIVAWVSGRFKVFFENFTAPGLQFSMLATIALLVLILNFNPSTEEYLKHNIAFESREVILALVMVCYPVFEADLFRRKKK